MSLTILNRLDIDINWYFSAVSVGFTIHRRGLQLSLIFFDIDIYYMSPARRAESQQYFHERFADMIRDKE